MTPAPEALRERLARNIQCWFDTHPDYPNLESYLIALGWRPQANVLEEAAKWADGISIPHPLPTVSSNVNASRGGWNSAGKSLAAAFRAKAKETGNG